MKLLTPILCALTFAHSNVEAQSNVGNAQINNAGLVAYESQLQALEAFIFAAETQRTLVMGGQISTDCAFEDMVIGMAEIMPKSQLNFPPASLPSILALPLWAAIQDVESLVTEASESVCAPAKNDKCCKQNSDPLESDVCKVRIGTYCKLIGRQIKGCTANSEDCP